MLNQKAQLQQLISQQSAAAEAPAREAPRPSTAPPSTKAGGGGRYNTEDEELNAVLAHRARAQASVEEQERKIAQLTALQDDLRSRLAEIGGEGEEEEEIPEEEEEEEEEDAADGEGGAEDGLAERVLQLLAIKTDECQQLASVVEEAREAGMDPENPRLQLAEQNLATRYQEIKELAAFAHRLGLGMEGDEEGEAEEQEEEEEEGDEEDEYFDDDDEKAEAILQKVQRLRQELDQCVDELRAVDANATGAVAKHPAFLKMRGMVVEKLEALHDELNQARESYARIAGHKGNGNKGNGNGKMVQSQSQQMTAKPDEEEEIDLSPMLKAALDKLWQRPYDCRIFTLQLLQGLAQLDNASLCMMTSCFARYLENHSVPTQ